MSQFYKIIFPSTLEEKKLRIPELFSRNFGNKISDPTKVLLPDGRLWHLGITKHNKVIWFQDGFDEFLQHYSIHERHILVFTYNGNSNFHVRIFDRSSCEIQYPRYDSSSIENVQDIGLCELETEDDDYVESSEADESEDEFVKKFNKKKACTSSPKPRRSCPRWAKANDCHEMNVKCKKEETNVSTPGSRKKANRNMLMNMYPHYRPKNAFFMVLLSDYNTRKMGYIPIRFARKHVSANITSLKVKDLSGKKEWVIGVHWKQSENKDVYLYTDWHQFLVDNELKAGDVCGFELMESEKDVLQFTKVNSA